MAKPKITKICEGLYKVELPDGQSYFIKQNGYIPKPIERISNG